MAKQSSVARAAQDDELELDYSERAGFLTGKAAAIADWQFRKLQAEGDFERLVWRLQAKKYWAAKNRESKARIVAYREQWRKDHRERHNEYSRKAKKKRRSDPKKRAAELAAKRAKFALKSQARREATVYTCAECGAQWSPIGRIPCVPPKYCMQRCASKAGHRRAKERALQSNSTEEKP